MLWIQFAKDNGLLEDIKELILTERTLQFTNLHTPNKVLKKLVSTNPLPFMEKKGLFDVHHVDNFVQAFLDGGVSNEDLNLLTQILQGGLMSTKVPNFVKLMELFSQSSLFTQSFVSLFKDHALDDSKKNVK